MKYVVTVTLTQESRFDVEIEAPDEDEAESIAKDAVWNDDYADDIRRTLEITDENYESMYIVCDNCGEEYNIHEEECPYCTEYPRDE